MGNLVIFGKHIMVEPFMGDLRFDRCILLANNSPNASDWPRYPESGVDQTSCPFQTTLPLARDTLGYIICSACVYPRATAAPGACCSSNKQQKKQAAAASSSCETSPADMAHAGMAPCRRLTQTDLASCSPLLRISTTTIRPAVQSQLHRNDRGLNVNKAS